MQRRINLRPRSLRGNVSMASHLPIYRNYAHQWRVFKDVLDCDLHRLDVSSCQECGRQIGQHSFTFYGPHSVEQSVVCSVRRQPITEEHVRATSEESSFLTLMNITRRLCSVLRLWHRLQISCHILLTDLLDALATRTEILQNGSTYKVS